MRKASIDLGTNTCLLLIAEWDPARLEVTSSVADRATVVRLGQGVDKTKELAPEAVTRTLECLKNYSLLCEDHGIDPGQVVAVATSQARDARNGAEFFDRVRSETGFQFRVLTGAEEARYTFLGGLLPGMRSDKTAVIDIGGGSTEFMAERGGQSLDLGSVRFTERYFKSNPVNDEDFWEAQDAIDLMLLEMDPWRKAIHRDTQLVAVAGTATTLAQWHLGQHFFNANEIDGCVITRGDVHRMVEELKWRTHSERLKLPGVTEGRADVLLAGALILWRSMELLGFEKLTVSTRGLRYGCLRL